METKRKPEPDRLSVARRDATEAGTCNFCNDYPRPLTVYEFTGTDRMRSLVVRICRPCLNELNRKANP